MVHNDELVVGETFINSLNGMVDIPYLTPESHQEEYLQQKVVAVYKLKQSSVS